MAHEKYKVCGGQMNATIMNGCESVEQLPLISLIIPVHNVRSYLCECLNSAIKQTYRNLEVLVIDDGSDDGSGTICDEYQMRDHRISVIHQENRGLSTARNTGLDRIKGEYVAFLDSDDAFHPNMIMTLWRQIEKTKAEIAASSISHHDTETDMKETNRCDLLRQENAIITSVEAMHLLLERKIPHAVWNKMYKRELWSGIRFPDGHDFEDVLTIFLIMERATKVALVKEALVMHRIRSQSITHTWTVDRLQDWLLAHLLLEEYIKKNTPSVFSFFEQARYKDLTLRQMIIRYANLLDISGEATSIRMCFELKRQIIRRRKKAKLLRMTTIICYCLFRTSPQLILKGYRYWFYITGVFHSLSLRY